MKENKWVIGTDDVQSLVIGIIDEVVCPQAGISMESMSEDTYWALEGKLRELIAHELGLNTTHHDCKEWEITPVRG